MAISDKLAEKLSTLDSFQRAEFLRRQVVHFECNSQMSEISKRTIALYQKRQNDAARYSKRMGQLGWLAVVFAILEVIFDTMPPVWDACVCFVFFGFWVFSSLKRLIEDNHDEMLFEMFALERARYEHEQSVNSYLRNKYDEELAWDILSCLGIDTGFITGLSKIYPLEPVK